MYWAEIELTVCVKKAELEDRLLQLEAEVQTLRSLPVGAKSGKEVRTIRSFDDMCFEHPATVSTSAESGPASGCEGEASRSVADRAQSSQGWRLR